MQLADLVEEDRAAVGGLEASGLALVGAGEGTSLVTEELALEQLARDRGAVDLYERRAAPGRVRVDRVGDELLADARLAADEHGDVGAGRLLDDGLDFAHRRADEQAELAFEPRTVFVAAGRSRCRRRRHRPGPARHGLDRVLEVLGGVRPAHEIVGAGLDRFHDLRAVAVVGHHDDVAGVAEILGAPQEVDARHAGQADRDQREGEVRVGHEFDRLLTGASRDGRVSPVGELRGHAPPLIGIALDNEDGAIPTASGGDGRGRVEAGKLHDDLPWWFRKRRAEPARRRFPPRRHRRRESRARDGCPAAECVEMFGVRHPGRFPLRTNFTVSKRMRRSNCAHMCLM